MTVCATVTLKIFIEKNVNNQNFVASNLDKYIAYK